MTTRPARRPASPGRGPAPIPQRSPNPRRRPALARAASVAALSLAVAVTLGGCSSSTVEADATPASPTAASPTPEASSSSAAPTSSAPAGDSDCNRVVTADTSNTELEKAATAVLDALDCASATDLHDQLTALYEDPEFQSQAKAAGWQLGINTVDVGGKTTAISMVDLSTSSSCQVQVITSPRTIGLICGDA